jgi:hypothetical protein
MQRTLLSIRLGSAASLQPVSVFSVRLVVG